MRSSFQTLVVLSCCGLKGTGGMCPPVRLCEEHSLLREQEFSLPTFCRICHLTSVSPKSNNIHLGFSLLANDQESFCSLTNKALFSWLMLMTFRLGFFPIHTSMWIPQNWHSFFGGDCLCFCKQSCWDVPCLSQVLIYETKAIHSIFKNCFAFPSPAHSLA